MRPDAPRYIETLPRRGYRFIAHVEKVANASSPVVAAEINQPPSPQTTPDSASALAEALPAQGVKEPPAEAVTVQQAAPPKRSRVKLIAAAVLMLASAAAALYWFYCPRTPVVTAIHQLTRTGRHKSIWMFHQPVTDGTRVYFNEFSGDRWHIAQVSTQGGEVSYIETPLIQQPFILGVCRE